MERAKLEEFVASAALLAAHLTRQCEESIAGQRNAAEDLRRSAEAVGQRVLGGSAELQQQARGAIREALSDELPPAARMLRDTATQLQAMAEQLRREQAATATRMRTLGWNTVVASGLAAAVVLAGSGYAAWHNMRRAEQAQVRAEVLEALQQVTITSCDGQPCLKLEDGTPRWSKNADYVLVQRDRVAAGTHASSP
ncbi:hypothetical protein [Luteimonas sp. SDU101]|uniref:hypothetical protein n=1 Tax=Luteimonas sp. SDU101 TaxID=3422593 RepID=UPI003EB92710